MAKSMLAGEAPAKTVVATSDELDAAEALEAQTRRTWAAAGAARVLADKAGALVDFKGEEGFTPLFVAA